MKASRTDMKGPVFDVFGTLVDWGDSCCGACPKGQSSTAHRVRRLYLCSSES